MNKFEEPQVREDTTPFGGTVETHPAYCQLQITRPSGHMNLYGSGFRHQHFISLTLFRSELHRSLSNDWYFATKERVICGKVEEERFLTGFVR